jgi:hypothetical protein
LIKEGSTFVVRAIGLCGFLLFYRLLLFAICESKVIDQLSPWIVRDQCFNDSPVRPLFLGAGLLNLRFTERGKVALFQCLVELLACGANVGVNGKCRYANLGLVVHNTELH